MSDRGLRYWLNWPHTRQDHVIAFALFFGMTLLAGYDGRPLVSLVAAIVTILLGIRLMAWNAEKAARGEAEDKDLIPSFGGDDEPGHARPGGPREPEGGRDRESAPRHASERDREGAREPEAADGGDPGDVEGR